MIREKRDTPIVIDLTGPQGNVFFLIAQAKKFAKQLNLDGDEIVTQMMSGDYDNAVEVFDEYFGSFVILER
jgi:hypothetical protein